MKNYTNLLLHSDFDRALFNFRLSLTLEPPTIGKGPRARLQGQKHPPRSRLLSIVKMSFEAHIVYKFSKGGNSHAIAFH